MNGYFFSSLPKASPTIKRPIRIITVKNRSNVYPRIPATPIAKATNPTKRLNLLTLMPVCDLIKFRPNRINPTPHPILPALSLSLKLSLTQYLPLPLSTHANALTRFHS